MKAWIKQFKAYYIRGDRSDNTLNGDDGNNVLIGRRGTDEMHGGGGNDLIFGNRGDDTLYGGDGDDWLFGFKGSDTMYGGDGADNFVFGSRINDDIAEVMDYNFYEGDRIHIRGVDADDVQLLKFARDGGGTTIYQLDEDGKRVDAIAHVNGVTDVSQIRNGLIFEDVSAAATSDFLG